MISVKDEGKIGWQVQVGMRSLYCSILIVGLSFIDLENNENKV